MVRQPKRLRFVITTLYAVFFAVYIFIGLQPAEAKSYDISGSLKIPEISLDIGVTTLELNERKLETPETIVGSYSRNPNKTLLIAHSTTAFKNLKKLKIGAEITYNDKTYRVLDKKTYEKSEINMTKLLKAAEKDTLILMTCSGKPIGELDATHRLIVTAELIDQ